MTTLTLWEMLTRIEAEDLQVVAEFFSGSAQFSAMGARFSGDKPVPTSTTTQMGYAIAENIPRAGRLGLATTVEALREFLHEIERRDLTHSEMKGRSDEILRTMRREARSRVFFALSAEDVPFYLNPLGMMGESVCVAFPSTETDVEEAAKCLALGRGTACVFHLMRVTEVGLAAVAKRLGIPYAPSWESYIKQITSRLAAPHGTKSRSWKRDQSFYAEVAGDLVALKNAWRNPTMHPRGHYTEERATEIYVATRSFMRHLAERVAEPRKRGRRKSP